MMPHVRHQQAAAQALLRDTPVFEEDDEDSEGSDEMIVSAHVQIDDQDEADGTDSEESKKEDSASELPPSRIQSRMPLHKKILSTS